MVSAKLKTFRKEFRKTFATGIIAAFGFITALAWKDVINEYLISKVSSLNPIQGLLISAILITLLSAIIIMLISKWNSDN